MILYVESNYVLEIALARENATEALEVLDRAEAGELALAIPVLAICEPYGTVSYRERKRAQDLRPARSQVEDLRRGEVHREIAEGLDTRLSDVLSVSIRERAQLEDVVGRLLACATILPLTPETFEAAQQHQATHGLDPADALIYATVLLDATGGDGGIPKIFVTRNRKHFDLESIRAELDEAGCTLAFEFEAIQRI